MIKKGEKITKNITYILQFIDSTRFMASSLSSLVNNLSEEIHKIKCKYGIDDENVKLAELNINIVTVYLNTQMYSNANVYVVTKIINKSLMKS